MGLFKKSDDKEYFKLLESFNQFKAGVMYQLVLRDEYLEIVKNKNDSAKLKYDQITDIYYGSETEIVSQNKSVIGRAAAGGLLFGGVGAVVGAVSGSGKKEKKKYKFVLVISYTSNSGEESFLSFEDVSVLAGHKFYKKLKEKADITYDEFL